MPAASHLLSKFNQLVDTVPDTEGIGNYMASQDTAGSKEADAVNVERRLSLASMIAASGSCLRA